MNRLRLTLALVCLVPRVAAAQAAPETIEYYAQDAIGSIRVVFNPAGTVLAPQDYAPFGQQLSTVPAMPKEGFGGQEKDDETDQANFHARMFQARTGRLTSVDPMFSGLFQPQRWNRYAYAANSPLSFTDFDGLDPIRVTTNGCDNRATPNWWSACKAREAFGEPSSEPGSIFTFTQTFTPRSGRGGGRGRTGGTSGTTTGGAEQTPTTDTAPTDTPTPTPCPPAPPGVSVTRNVFAARAVGLALDSGPMAAANQLVKYAGVYMLFRNGGPMDYRNRFRDAPRVQDFGNLNYGAVTAAAGIPAEVGLRAAGWGQQRAGTSSAEWGSPLGRPPYGDDPVDQAMISHGINLALGQPSCK